MTEPDLSKLNSGWIARGDGWAVRAETREDALRLFRETEAKYREIDARPFLYEKDDRSLKDLANKQSLDKPMHAA